jgi:hypothetical protein
MFDPETHYFVFLQLFHLETKGNKGFFVFEMNINHKLLSIALNHHPHFFHFFLLLFILILNTLRANEKTFPSFQEQKNNVFFGDPDLLRFSCVFLM